MQRGRRSGNGARVPSSDPTHGATMQWPTTKKAKTWEQKKWERRGSPFQRPAGTRPDPHKAVPQHPSGPHPCSQNPNYEGAGWRQRAGVRSVGLRVRARGATHQGSHCLVCCLELKPKKQKKGRAGIFHPCVFLARRQSIHSPFREPATLCERKQHPPLALSRFTILLPHALPPLPIHSLRHAGNKQEQGGGIVQTGFVFGDQTPRGPCNTTGLY
jgi:hypothetical protein